MVSKVGAIADYSRRKIRALRISGSLAGTAAVNEDDVLVFQRIVLLTT